MKKNDKKRQKATKKDTLKAIAKRLNVTERTLQREKKKGTLNDYILKKEVEIVKKKTIQASFKEVQSDFKSNFLNLLNNLSQGLGSINYNEIDDKDKAYLAVQFVEKVGKHNKNG